MSDVFFNGKLAGTVSDGASFMKEVVEQRRKGKISQLLNIQYNTKEDNVHIFLDKNRLRRPLIIAKDGKSLLGASHIEKLKKREIQWSELINQGVIEFLDAAEEENSYIAMVESELTPEHTHLEINPAAMFGMNTSIIPYANYNQSTRLLRGQKTQEQGGGCYALNFLNRLDTNVNMLHYPHTPIVRSFTQSLFGDGIAGGQNIVIALLNWEGYNMEDAVVINRGSLDQGFGRSTHFRPYSAEKLRYPGGQMDEIKIPTKDIQGYTLEEHYRFLEEDGIIFPEAQISGGEVLIGKTSPPRFLSKLETFATVANIKKDTSTRVKFGEQGIVSKVFITESEDGNQLIHAEVRDTRIPEIGDKFANRHGQKGVIGYIASPEDVPFTASGIRPDVIFSPFGISKRMTVSHVLEMLAGKVGALAGRFIDGTAFQSETVEDLRSQLLGLGFREDGTETLYDGRTGREYKARIFIGNMFYLRLKHQVADKMQARARGRVTLLTRQPTAGKAMEGGLRIGEMEKETLVGHGASLMMKERFDSDRIVIHICEKCGDIASFDAYAKKPTCLACGEKAKASPIELSYAFVLFFNELKSIGVMPKLILKDKFA